MDRDKFAAGKSQDEIEAAKSGKLQAPETIKKAEDVTVKRDMADITTINPLPNGRAVGAGHAAGAETLISDSFIDSLNKYMPPEK